jgi:hypothetical protein
VRREAEEWWREAAVDGGGRPTRFGHFEDFGCEVREGDPI